MCFINTQVWIFIQEVSVLKLKIIVGFGYIEGGISHDLVEKSFPLATHKISYIPLEGLVLII